VHTLIALFDAPIPARGALAALASLGVDAADIAVVPPLPGGAPPAGAPDFALPSDPSALLRTLDGWGVSAADAQTCAEGVKRGAILLAVRVPTLSLPPVRAAVDAFAVVSLSAHRARWEADPPLHYGGAEADPPGVVGPQPSTGAEPREVGVGA
jgi:hypothetical protein